MSALLDFVATPEFLTGSFVSGLLGAGIGYISTRNSDRRKMAHEDLKSNRQIIRETSTAFSEVCSAVIEKAIDSKGVFNSVMDAVQNMNEIPDKKALAKLEYAVDLGNESKRITTAFNNLRVVAPVAVLDKATKLNAAILALTQTLTVPLARPPVLVEAGKAFEEFTNAVRAEQGLEPYTAQDAGSARATYMETLTKQMAAYIKETQEEARRFGFLEPGSVPESPIRAGDLTNDHVGQFVGCNQAGFNYGAEIVSVSRQEFGPHPGILLRLKHPPIPGGMPAHEDRSRLTFDHILQLVELPDHPPQS